MSYPITPILLVKFNKFKLNVSRQLVDDFRRQNLSEDVIEHSENQTMDDKMVKRKHSIELGKVVKVVLEQLDNEYIVKYGLARQTGSVPMKKVNRKAPVKRNVKFEPKSKFKSKNSVKATKMKQQPTPKNGRPKFILPSIKKKTRESPRVTKTA